MKKITLKDIAEVTGLSINSVSRALKDKDSISVETRKMVQQVAKEMGYIPNSVSYTHLSLHPDHAVYDASLHGSDQGRRFHTHHDRQCGIDLGGHHPVPLH